MVSLSLLPVAVFLKPVCAQCWGPLLVSLVTAQGQGERTVQFWLRTILGMAACEDILEEIIVGFSSNRFEVSPR